MPAQTLAPWLCLYMCVEIVVIIKVGSEGNVAVYNASLK